MPRAPHNSDELKYWKAVAEKLNDLFNFSSARLAKQQEELADLDAIVDNLEYEARCRATDE